MKLGLIPINIGMQSAEQIVGLAKVAEASGFESVWTFEHVIVPVDYESKYPYDKSGKMGAAPETNFVDPLLALTYIAAHTEKLRLGTGVNILSQANPLYVAKQTASLDLLSGGRFMLGVGIGWLQEEFKALGVPFEKRGKRFDDYVAAMRKVWSGDVVEHQSEFIQWEGFKSYPIPTQNPMPVIMGGIAGKIHERIAKFGNGWYAPTSDADELRHHFGEIKKACDAIGRDFAEIEMTCMWGGKGGKEAMAEFEALGVHRLVMPIFALGKNPVEGIQKTGEELLA